MRHKARLCVYVLMFDEPLGDPSRPRCCARYYVGCTYLHRLYERIREHASGNAHCALTRAAHERGIGFTLVNVFEDLGYDDEKRFKRGGHFERLDVRNGKRIVVRTPLPVSAFEESEILRDMYSPSSLWLTPDEVNRYVL